MAHGKSGARSLLIRLNSKFYTKYLPYDNSITAETIIKNVVDDPHGARGVLMHPFLPFLITEKIQCFLGNSLMVGFELYHFNIILYKSILKRTDG